MKLRVLSRARETIYEVKEKVNRDVDTSSGAICYKRLNFAPLLKHRYICSCKEDSVPFHGVLPGAEARPEQVLVRYSVDVQPM